MRKLAKFLAAAALGAALPVMLAPAASAQTPTVAPAEKAAIDRANAAIRAKDYATARTILTGPELAQSANAQLTLHQLYAEGLGGPKDAAAADAALRRAAELGEPRAMYNVAVALMKVGTPASKAEAKGWYIQAADKGLTQARTILGAMQWEDGNHAGAVEQWQRAGSDPSAKMCLGMANATGKGLAADMVMANYQFFRLGIQALVSGRGCARVAAAAGSAEAQFLLGQWHLVKQGGEFDAAKAVKLLTDASDQRHVRAAGLLAATLDDGTLVPRDAAGAYTHYLRAAEGDPSHYGRLGEMALKGDGTERSVANAIQFWEKDDYGGHGYQLGLIYAGGEGWPRDEAKAIYAMGAADEEDEPKARAWLKALADSGNAEAQLAYAREIENDEPETDASGRELTDDEQEAAERKVEALALSYVRRAAAQKLPEAMVELAKEGDISDAEQVRLMRAAAAVNYGHAMLELAVYHSMGWYGFAKDEAAERAWEERAARTGDKFVLADLGSKYATAGALTSNFIGREAGAEERMNERYMLARRYYEAAYAAGYTGVAASIASLYDHPNRPALDNPALSFKWAQAAFKTDPTANAMETLSTHYEKGRGTPVDLLKAWFWRRVAQGNSSDANKQKRVDALWQKLPAALRTNGERAMMACEMKQYRGCSI